MFQVLLGAAALLALGKMGVDKVCDTVSSVKTDGFKDTAVKEAKSVALGVEKIIKESQSK